MKLKLKVTTQGTRAKVCSMHWFHPMYRHKHVQLAYAPKWSGEDIYKAPPRVR